MDVLFDLFFELLHGLEFFFEVEQFGLKSSKEVFDNRIVQTISFSGHTDEHPLFSQQMLALRI